MCCVKYTQTFLIHPLIQWTNQLLNQSIGQLNPGAWTYTCGGTELTWSADWRSCPSLCLLWSCTSAAWATPWPASRTGWDSCTRALRRRHTSASRTPWLSVSQLFSSCHFRHQCQCKITFILTLWQFCYSVRAVISCQWFLLTSSKLMPFKIN